MATIQSRRPISSNSSYLSKDSTQKKTPVISTPRVQLSHERNNFTIASKPANWASAQDSMTRDKSVAINNVTVSRAPQKMLSVDKKNCSKSNSFDKMLSTSIDKKLIEIDQTESSTDDIGLFLKIDSQASESPQTSNGHEAVTRTKNQHNHTIDCLNDFKLKEVANKPVSAEWTGPSSSKDLPRENGLISYEAKGAKPKTRGKYRKLIRSVTTESYQHAVRKQLLEEQLYQIGLEVHEECEEKEHDSNSTPTEEQGEFEYFANIESDSATGARTTNGTTKALKNFRHKKLTDDESEFSSNRTRQGRRLLRLPSFSKKTRYSRLTKSDSVNSIEEGLSGRYRAPLKKSYSTSDAYEEERDIDVDEDKVLAQYYSPFCPRRMAICPHMNIPEMKQLETYLVLTRLKQFCFI